MASQMFFSKSVQCHWTIFTGASSLFASDGVTNEMSGYELDDHSGWY